jgi:hypothetical protein
LKASYEYSAGILKTNERIFDQQDVQAALLSFDTYINAFLNKPYQRQYCWVQALKNSADEAETPDYSSVDTSEQLVNMTSISGFPTIAPDDSMLEDSNGNRVYFETNSAVGHQIVDTCNEGSLCFVTGMVDIAKEYHYLKQLQSVVLVPRAAASVQPEVAYATAASSTADIASTEQVSMCMPSFDCNKASTNVEKANL